MRSERKHNIYVNDDVYCLDLSMCVATVVLIYVNDADKQAHQLITRLYPF